LKRRSEEVVAVGALFCSPMSIDAFYDWRILVSVRGDPKSRKSLQSSPNELIVLGGSFPMAIA
jgi:hypothetical protein